MRNYFKAFITVIDKSDGHVKIGATRLAFFDDTSAEETATAYVAVQKFKAENPKAQISVWRHPRCSHAWDDVRLIGVARDGGALRGLEAWNAAQVERTEETPRNPNAVSEALAAIRAARLTGG